MKPALASCALAVSTWVPVKLGSEIVAVPVETLTVTVLPLAALLPLSGLVLMTRPDFTLELAWSCSCGVSPAAVICFAAWA